MTFRCDCPGSAVGVRQMKPELKSNRKKKPVTCVKARLTRSIDRLVALTAHSDHEVRWEAALALAELGDAGRRRMVAVLRTTTDTTVRLVLMQLLAAINPTAVVEVTALLWSLLEAHPDAEHFAACRDAMHMLQIAPASSKTSDPS